MSAPRDCDCFLSTNYFVDKLGNRTIRWHFHYDGTDDSIREQLILMGLGGGSVGEEDSTADGLSSDEFDSLRCKLDAERRRRLDLDDEEVRNRRRDECGTRFEGMRNAAAYRFHSDGDSSWLDPRCAAALEAAAEPGATKEVVLAAAGGVELVPDRIFALPVLSPEACAMLDEELQNFGTACAEVKTRPNSMNRFGVLLDEAGMSSGVTDPLLRDVIVPLSAALFASPRGPRSGDKGDETRMILGMCQSLDHHHAFTVNYRSESSASSGGEADFDRDLSLHFDNAEVTLNVLIGGDEFEGGELSFEGPSPASPTSFARLRTPVKYEHSLGWGVLHLGSEMHRALPVDDGARRNLIVWCRSARHRLQYGCPMCGSTDLLVEPVLRRYLNAGAAHRPMCALM